MYEKIHTQTDSIRHSIYIESRKQFLFKYNTPPNQPEKNWYRSTKTAMSEANTETIEGKFVTHHVLSFIFQLYVANACVCRNSSTKKNVHITFSYTHTYTTHSIQFNSIQFNLIQCTIRAPYSFSLWHYFILDELLSLPTDSGDNIANVCVCSYERWKQARTVTKPF